jgi:hypothetical protein
MRPLLTLVLAAVLRMTAAQTAVETILDTAEKTQLKRFDLKQLDDNQVFIAMPYAGSRFLNRLQPYVAQSAVLEHIDLIYTAFPTDNNARQRELNKHRILELNKRLPEALELPVERWKFIEQTACLSENDARELPHGFLLTFSEELDAPDFTNGARLQMLTKGDSTVTNALSRNKNWKKMLVVTDLTGSMSPFTAQLLLWFKLAQHTGKVEHLVFFNDGDGKNDDLKVIGNTGGLYDIKPENFDEIARMANQVVKKGNGGDEPENNIEALLHGIKICPQCEEVIMIADNWATPRDYSLLKEVNKPVHIILCGTEEGINTDYLNLARETGGSVHTIEQDINDLINLNEGQEIKIGKEVFIIKNGKFELFKRI